MSQPPKIQINVNAPTHSFQIRPMAFITILQHIYRLWHKNDPKSEYGYGILIGKLEGTTRIVTEAVPVMHGKHPDIVFEEQFYKHWEDLNKLKVDMDVKEECIGWYKVIDRDMKMKACDVRNQVKLQTMNAKYMAMLIDPQVFLDGKGYGFSVFRLKQSAGIFHEMCDYDKMPWEVLELGADVDKVVNMVIDMIKKVPTDEPFVEELDEVKIPEIPKGGGEDEGDYVTPKMDPNSPFFL